MGFKQHQKILDACPHPVLAIDQGLIITCANVASTQTLQILSNGAALNGSALSELERASIDLNQTPLSVEHPSQSLLFTFSAILNQAGYTVSAETHTGGSNKW